MKVPRVVFDAGAMIAIERGHPLVRQYVLLATKNKVELSTSSAAVAQVWRGGSTQVRLARLLRSDLVEERPLDQIASRRIGLLAASTGESDVVDGHVAWIAEDRNAVIVTSDPDDLRKWGIPGTRLVGC